MSWEKQTKSTTQNCLPEKGRTGRGGGSRARRESLWHFIMSLKSQVSLRRRNILGVESEFSWNHVLLRDFNILDFPSCAGEVKTCEEQNIGEFLFAAVSYPIWLESDFWYNT